MKKFCLVLLIANCVFAQNAYSLTVKTGAMVFINDIKEDYGNYFEVSGVISGDNASVSNGMGEAAASNEWPQLTAAKKAELIRQRYGVTGGDFEVISNYGHIWEQEVGYTPGWYSQNSQVWDPAVSHQATASISNAIAESTGSYDSDWNHWENGHHLINDGGATRAAFVEGSAGGGLPESMEGIGDGSTSLYMSFAEGNYLLSINYNLWAYASGMGDSSEVDLRSIVQSSFSIIDGNATINWYSPDYSILAIMQSGGEDFSESRSGAFVLGITSSTGITGVLEFSTRAEGSITTTEPIQPVPEPATMLLFGTGLAGLAGSRIKRKKGR